MAKSDDVRIPRTLFATIIIVLIVIGMIVISLLSNYFQTLRRAHSSFENYYAFRGCVQLLQKSDTSGQCITDGGQIIKIVEYKNRWYLDGDLPVCYGKICF